MSGAQPDMIEGSTLEEAKFKCHITAQSDSLSIT